MDEIIRSALVLERGRKEALAALYREHRILMGIAFDLDEDMRETFLRSQTLNGRPLAEDLARKILGDMRQAASDAADKALGITEIEPYLRDDVLEELRAQHKEKQTERKVDA